MKVYVAYRETGLGSPIEGVCKKYKDAERLYGSYCLIDECELI